MSNIDKAFSIYSRHIYDEEKMRLLAEYNLKIPGSVPSVLWELFGATLTGMKGTGDTGADLDGWEVKSAINGSSYEYQYHLNTGEYKLKEDCEVDHLFCSYSKTYENVVVYAVHGKDLAPDHFDIWLPLYRQNYSVVDPARRKQRFRKSISHSKIVARGAKVLEIKNGNVSQRNDSVIPEFNRIRT